MSVPKKRRTSGSKGKRRSHYKTTPANPQACPKCGAAKLSHKACSKCGNYNGKEVIKIKSSLNKKKK